MNTWLKRYALTGLVLGLSAFNSFAAESTVYYFEDGTVTVTPRDSYNVPVAKSEVQPLLNAPVPLPTLNEKPRLIVQPVAYQQQTPAPTPASEVPHLQSTPTTPETTSQPGCCDGPIITPRSNDALPKSTITVPLAAMYRDVYNSIPFSRVEFNHYPNYRHDATMEFLFNQMRTTIINRSTGAAGNDYTYGPAYGGYLGYPYYDPPAYPFSYGLRIHRSR